MTVIESIKTFLLAERDRAISRKCRFAMGNPSWFAAEGERRAYQAAIDELKRLEADDDEMERHIERLLSLRRAALAPEAQAPSGEPWRPAVPRDYRQRQIGEWVASTFGMAAASIDERVARLVEEVVELAQAEDFPAESIAAIVRHVFSKPKGDAEQESGGVGVTLLAYCGAKGFSADESEARECARVLSVGADHFRQRQNAKHAAGIGAPAGASAISLPVRPSCGGEPEASPEGPRDWLDQEIAAAERAVYALAEMAPSERDGPLEQAQERLRALEDVRDHLPAPAGEASPAVVSERLGLARLLEWARANGSDECLEAIEREIAALGPPSIAEDLRTPEPGAFDGAVVVGGDDQLEREIEALAREVAREDRNRAVWEALAELRGELEPNSSRLSAGLRFAIDALDRLAERFKP